MDKKKSIEYFERLDQVAEDVISLLSQAMDVNTVFLASNDNNTNFIVKAFNRKAQLLTEGESSPFEDVLCKLVTNQPEEPIVITDLASDELSVNHPVTLQIGTGCFIGAPVYNSNGKIFGTICAFDTKPYTFTSYDIKLIKTLSSLLSQTIYLENLMMKDHLTDLYNSFYLKGIFDHYDSVNNPYSLLYIDLDHFKDVNDNYGHDMGDQLLREVATIFKRLVPEKSVVARIGGDEFVLLIPTTTKEMTEAIDVGKQVIETLNTTSINIDGHELHISASIGVTFVEPGKNLKVLMNEADVAMYHAKRSGRGNLKKTRI